ncbi:MAG TPA: ABC transporter ATP-binding protein [Candidatus Saccharimonadales bacterium]|jgi:ABC-type lipoprotein export system ATPase subunit|nr:ABC transporter ATP-binding protein [Candidatus Saccharimonadales bacterium]
MDVKSPPGGEVSLPKSRSNNNLITVKSLNKQFDTKSSSVKVLYDINFDIPNNSFSIIFGPSGSGKTTLLNILSGLEPPTTGSVEIEGQNLYSLNSDQRALFRAKTMGIVHQVNYWVKSLSVLENVAMPLYLTGVDRNNALKTAMENLDIVGMADFAHSHPIVLSGGQQQRVSMARALVANPQLILADEPTGNLDSKNGKMIMDLLIKCQKELNRTIILVTHNIEYLPLSDIQLYMVDGKLTEAGHGEGVPVTEIINSLKTQLTELNKLEKRQ